MSNLLIKNFPREVLQGIKAEAALEGKTLREWVIERFKPGWVESKAKKEAVRVAIQSKVPDEVQVLVSEPRWIPIPGRTSFKMCRQHKDQYCPLCEMD